MPVTTQPTSITSRGVYVPGSIVDSPSIGIINIGKTLRDFINAKNAGITQPVATTNGTATQVINNSPQATTPTTGTSSNTLVEYGIYIGIALLIFWQLKK